MYKHITALFLSALAANTAMAATDGENQAASFAKIYDSVCLKHMENIDALRKKLQSVPKLPPEYASHFHFDGTGDVWPVPDQYGKFVVSLSAEKSICAIYANKLDTEAVKKQFANLVAHAPAPYVAEQVRDDRKQTPNGPTQTVSYEWSLPNTTRKMLFTLTVAPSETTALQALGSAAIICPERCQ